MRTTTAGGILRAGTLGVPPLHQKDGVDMRADVEWDIDANLPLYTRDYLRLMKEKEEVRGLLRLTQEELEQRKRNNDSLKED